MVDLQRTCVSPQTSMLQVMARINESEHGIALVVDERGRLLDTITDGDMRRAILAGADLSQPVSKLQSRRTGPPTTAPVGTPKSELIQVMRAKSIRQIPLLDKSGVVSDLAVLDHLVEEALPEPAAVVMAGGFGKRMMPLTANVPKPMLPVGERPIVERTIENLKSAGIRRVYMATHYRAEVLTEHFGNGEQFGVEMNYVDEEVPLGTAGALSRLQGNRDVLLVVNGDIVTDLNYRSLLRFHREHEAEMTVGVRQYEFHVPYGVVSTAEARVTGITEKPTQRMFVNAGIYLIEPHVCALVPAGKKFDMTDLIEKMIAEKRRVCAFPISEYWVDIGQQEEYARAQARAAAGEANR